MQVTGKIKDVFEKFRSSCKEGKFDLNKTYSLYISEESEKTPEEIRRKAQNDKYWVLEREFSEWSKVGYTTMHNRLLAEYAPILTEKGKDGKQHKKWVLKPKGFNWEKQMFNHYKPTNKFIKDENGNEYEAFYELKGSRNMSVKEFDRLLEGLINEIVGSEAPIDVN